MLEDLGKGGSSNLIFILMLAILTSQILLYRSVQRSGNYLKFGYITKEDAGRYYCTASNPFGNVTKVAEVLVSRKCKIFYIA